MERPLAPYRVLDLSDETGMLCGRILADLGADVILVEPPSGHPARNIGPFYGNKPHPEHSLHWFAFNAGKRGITLNMETDRGKELFRRLVADSHFLIECFTPGYLKGLGLDYPRLKKINPGLVMVSLTPYGQTGPRSHYRTPDLVAMALGGLMHLTGDADRPPVRMSFPLSYSMAGADAACACLIAHHHRRRTGEGQHIDLSLVHSASWLTINILPWWELEKRIIQRAGPLRGGRGAGVLQRLIWECQDGSVCFLLLGGATGAKQNPPLAKWMAEEGMADDFIAGFDWEHLDMWKSPPELYQRLDDAIARFFRVHTKEELYRGASERGIMLTPVNTVGDVTRSQQHAARQFWQQVEHPELGTSLTYPGSFYRTGVEPLPTSRAPLIGEHSREVYGELGLSPAELTALKEEGVI